MKNDIVCRMKSVFTVRLAFIVGSVLLFNLDLFLLPP